MTADGIESNDELWRSIRREAETAVAADPALGGSLSAAILDHTDLGSAVAWQIGERLGGSTVQRRLFAHVAHDAFLAAPDLVEAASRDLRWIALQDPANPGLLHPLITFKGYVALQAFRVSSWLWRADRTDLALLLQSESSNALQVNIHPSATIGTPVFLDHATGIVLGASVEIGDEVTILQNVTAGRKDPLSGRAPRIGRGVLLSTGATILGDVRIGDFARIGAGAIVTTDVPAGCTAVGVPAHLTNCPEEAALV